MGQCSWGWGTPAARTPVGHLHTLGSKESPGHTRGATERHRRLQPDAFHPPLVPRSGFQARLRRSLGRVSQLCRVGHVPEPCKASGTEQQSSQEPPRVSGGRLRWELAASREPEVYLVDCNDAQCHDAVDTIAGHKAAATGRPALGVTNIQAISQLIERCVAGKRGAHSTTCSTTPQASASWENCGISM